MPPADENTGFCEVCGAQLFPDSGYCSQCGTKVPAMKEIHSSRERKDLSQYQLYKVYSIINNFLYRGTYFDNLKIDWFVVDQQELHVPFEKAIEGYKQLSLTARISPQNYITQCFSWEQANLLKKYLASLQKTNATIQGCQLPVGSNVSGYRDVPPPRGTDFILLHKKSIYNLPFKVEGFFNTKMAEERIVGDDQSITVVSGINIRDVQKLLKKKENKK
jgi:hypothetical protein